MGRSVTGRSPEEEEGKQDAAVGPQGNSGTVEWMGGGIARDRRDMHATGHPLIHSPSASRSIRPGTPGLVPPTPALCHVPATSQKSLCKFVQFSLPASSFIAYARDSASTSWIHSPASVLPCIGTGRATIWTRSCGLGSSGRPPRCGGACVSHVGKVGESARGAGQGPSVMDAWAKLAVA